jgi:hypothetical protein
MVRVGVWSRLSVSKTVALFRLFCHFEASEIISSDYDIRGTR